MAIKEFTATSPETASSFWALMTLKPNQPTDSTQAPRASQMILEGGMPMGVPSAL